MKKLILLLVGTFLLYNCSNDDDSLRTIESKEINEVELFNKADFDKLNEDAMKIKVAIDVFNNITKGPTNPTLEYPWNGPYNTIGYKYKMTSVPVRIQFLPNTYPGIPAGYYDCDIYKYIGSVQLPSNAIAGKPLGNIQNLGFIDFGPNGYTKGVLGSLDSNNVLHLNTTIVHVIRNIVGINVNRTLPDNLTGVSTVQLPYVVAIL